MLSQELKSICLTLNQIEVKGEQNLAYLYGCITTIKDVIEKLDNPDKEVMV